MNSSVSNTSTPISSQECAAIVSKITETCSAELREIGTLQSKVPKELQDCYDTNSCTLKQNQEFLKLICPIIKKYNDCSGPAMDCLKTMPNITRYTSFKTMIECDTFSASLNDTLTSGNGKNVASLFSILAFSLFLL